MIALSETMDSMIQIKESQNQSIWYGSESASTWMFNELKPKTTYYVTEIWNLRSSGRSFKCPNVRKFSTSNIGTQYYYLCGTCMNN